jgi:hypothetical protein
MPRAFAIGADRIFQDRRKEEVHNREQYYAKHNVVIPIGLRSNRISSNLAKFDSTVSNRTYTNVRFAAN